MIPLEDAVLAAIAQGADTVDSIARVLRVAREDVERAINRLRSLGLVRTEERGWWVFRKNKVVLSEEGYARAVKVLERLREIAKEVEREVKLGDKELINELGTSWSYILPLLLWLNFIDLAFLGSFLAASESDLDYDVDYGSIDV